MVHTHKTNHKPFYKSKLIWLIPSPLLAIPALIYPGISIYGAYVFNQVPDRVSSFATTPASFGLAYQEVSFPSAAKDHLTLRGWWIPNPASKQALIIVHGKAANRAERIVLSKPFWDMGYNLLFFDLRGHGTSEGNHYYFGQYESWDTVGAFNFVKSQGFTPKNIGLFGTSMGAATALLAMGHCDEIQTVFSDSSFAELGELVRERLPIEKGVPSFFLPGILTAAHILMDFNVDEVRPEVILGELHHKHIFLMHGGADSVIPVAHFYRLKAAGGDNIVGTWVVPEADHTQSYDLYPQKYLQTVEAFFKTYLGH